MKDKLQADDSLLYLIPSHYTGLWQPCDVGINKSLKKRLKKCASKWRRNKRSTLNSGEKLPAPGRIDILMLLKQIWEEFPVEVVQNSFKGCGYVFEDEVDYSM